MADHSVGTPASAKTPRDAGQSLAVDTTTDPPTTTADLALRGQTLAPLAIVGAYTSIIGISGSFAVRGGPVLDLPSGTCDASDSHALH
jgi:hypothetical protein